METVTLYITGMACGGCASTIASTLQKLDGVAEASVTHTDGTATITFDPSIVQLAQIKAAISTTGYEVVN